MSSAVIAAIAFIAAGAYPDFLPAPSGIGGEMLPLSTRSLGMGGTCSGVLDTAGLCFSNPAASAWASRAGIIWQAALRNGDDPATDGKMAFPMLSAVLPLPHGLVLSGGISQRSRLFATDTLTAGEDYRASYLWHGGLSEAEACVSILASDWLSFGLGARSSFGSVRSDVALRGFQPGPGAPLSTEFADEALFRPCWGLLASTFIRTRYFELGASLITDRSGDIDINRDFAGSTETESSTELYTIPGEVNLGASIEPVPWLTLAADLHSRKALTLPGARVDRGSVVSAGAEAANGRFAVRAGYSFMDGLWRDGTDRYSLGAGYTFAGGRAGVDLAVTRDICDDFSETGVFVSLWASEDWRGE